MDSYNGEKFPSIDEFLLEDNEHNGQNTHMPQFYNFTHEKYTQLETKFILMNKLNSIIGSVLIYNFDKYTFELINIDKDVLNIKLL